MKVKIDDRAFGRGTWEGDVPLKDLDIDLTDDGRPANDEACNEALFRYFNRVDQADCNRLERIGYRLPSLSVGDLITWGDPLLKLERTYQVAPMGFLLIAPGEEPRSVEGLRLS